MEHEMTLRVLIMREAGTWVAQCLEYNIGAQAEDLDQLQERLTGALRLELLTSMREAGTPFAGIPAAPSHFEDLWQRRSGGFVPARPSRVPAGGSDVSLNWALVA